MASLTLCLLDSRPLRGARELCANATASSILSALQQPAHFRVPSCWRRIAPLQSWLPSHGMPEACLLQGMHCRQLDRMQQSTMSCDEPRPPSVHQALTHFAHGNRTCMHHCSLGRTPDELYEVHDVDVEVHIQIRLRVAALSFQQPGKVLTQQLRHLIYLAQSQTSSALRSQSKIVVFPYTSTSCASITYGIQPCCCASWQDDIQWDSHPSRHEILPYCLPQV